MILFQLVRGVLEIYQLDKSSTYGFQDALNFDLGLTNWVFWVIDEENLALAALWSLETSDLYIFVEEPCHRRMIHSVRGIKSTFIN